MNCQACGYPILSTIELGVMPTGERALGASCTHCGRVVKLIELEIRAPKYSAKELLAKQNRNT